eukprot:symbB.v1.2.005051.t1/scaffold291.1/size238869/16
MDSAGALVLATPQDVSWRSLLRRRANGRNGGHDEPEPENEQGEAQTDPVDPWDEEWTEVDDPRRLLRFFVRLVVFMVGCVVPPGAVCLLGFSLYSQDPAVVAISCVVCTPRNILWVHHGMIIFSVWQYSLHLIPEARSSAILLPCFLTSMIHLTSCWPTVGSDFNWQMLLNLVDRLGFNHRLLWIYRVFRWAMLSMFVGRLVTFTHATWSNAYRRIIGSDRQALWCVVMFVIGIICSLCTLTWWFDWAFPMKLSSLESFIISFLVLGTFAVAQLSEEELRSYSQERRQNLSRILVFAHLFCAVLSCEARMRIHQATAYVTLSHVIFFSLLLLMNRREIWHEMRVYLGPLQKVDSAESEFPQEFTVETLTQ